MTEGITINGVLDGNGAMHPLRSQRRTPRFRREGFNGYRRRQPCNCRYRCIPKGEGEAGAAADRRRKIVARRIHLIPLKVVANLVTHARDGDIALMPAQTDC